MVYVKRRIEVLRLFSHLHGFVIANEEATCSGTFVIDWRDESWRNSPTKCWLGACSALHTRVMGEVVNLKRARKAKARVEAETDAAAKRLQHGRSKAEKKLRKAEQDAAKRRLDGHKRDDDG